LSRFAVADGVLVELGAGGHDLPLTRVAADVFRSERVRWRFERDAGGAVVAVVRETMDGGSRRIARGAAPSP
jgi:hypothetical protein